MVATLRSEYPWRLIIVITEMDERAIDAASKETVVCSSARWKEKSIKRSRSSINKRAIVYYHHAAVEHQCMVCAHQDVLVRRYNKDFGHDNKAFKTQRTVFGYPHDTCGRYLKWRDKQNKWKYNINKGCQIESNLSFYKRTVFGHRSQAIWACRVVHSANHTNTRTQEKWYTHKLIGLQRNNFRTANKVFRRVLESSFCSATARRCRRNCFFIALQICPFERLWCGPCLMVLGLRVSADPWLSAISTQEIGSKPFLASFRGMALCVTLKLLRVVDNTAWSHVFKQQPKHLADIPHLDTRGDRRGPKFWQLGGGSTRKYYVYAPHSTAISTTNLGSSHAIVVKLAIWNYMKLPQAILKHLEHSASYVKLSEVIWSYLRLYEIICKYEGLFKAILDQSRQPKTIWDCFIISEIIWDHLKQYENIWGHTHLYEIALDCMEWHTKCQKAWIAA